MTDDDANNEFRSAQRLFEQKDLNGAKQILDGLLKTAPQHLEGLRLAAWIAATAEDWRHANECLGRALELAPGNAGLHYQYAVTCDKLGQPDTAIVQLRRAVDLDPNLAEAHRRLADLLFARGTLAEARTHYQRVLELRPDQHESLELLGRTMAGQGRAADYIRYCQRHIEQHPDDIGARLQLGLALKRQGDLDGALANYHEVIARQPNCYEVYLYAAMIHRAREDTDAAIECLQKAVGLDPNRGEAKALLCDTFERSNKLEDAERLAREILAQGVNYGPQVRARAAVVLASILRRSKRAEEGYALLSDIDIPTDPNEAQAVCFELGRLADSLGKYAVAFEYFEKGNAALAVEQNAREEDRIAFRRKITRVRSTFTPEWVSTWPKYPTEDDLTALVFLVGFPRSGTTLIDQVLDCHPDIQVMEERPTMSYIQDELERLTGNDLGAIAHLTTGQWQQLRAQYLSRASQYTEPGMGSLIVDKLPLNLIWAGICHWLFPETRFIFAIRHPCDAVLSCFMQSFGFNQGNSNFYTLEDGARLYDEAMETWYHYRSILPIVCHQYRYEDLVDDFEDTVRGILDFLGKPWHPDVLQFDRRARKSGHIPTASYGQVSQPLYRSARFRWHHYRAQMATVLPLLEPWARRFGYDD